MSEQVVVGSVVRLRALPAPSMVVEEVDAGKAGCCWFDGNTVQRDKFPVAVLQVEKYDPKATGVQLIDTRGDRPRRGPFG